MGKKALKTLKSVTQVTIVLMSFLGSIQCFGIVDPPPIKFGAEPELNFRAVLSHSDWNLTYLFEGLTRQETDDRRLMQFRAGGYYRLLKNLKLGFFVIEQWGARHEEDWVLKPDLSGWQWADSKGRAETLLSFVVMPRVILSFLGPHWVGELRSRFVLNTFNQHQAIRVRPGVSYFWIKDGEPILNAFLRYEAYFPLNFSEKTIYEHWLYLGALYHWTEHWKIGAYGAYRNVVWTTNPTFRAVAGRSFESRAQSFVIGLQLMLREKIE